MLVISSKQERRPIDPERMCCEYRTKMPLPVYRQNCGSWVRVILFKSENVSVHNHLRIHTVVTYTYTYTYTQAGTHECLSIRGPYIPDIYRSCKDKGMVFVKISTISELTEKNHTKHTSSLLVYRSELTIFRIQRRINIST